MKADWKKILFLAVCAELMLFYITELEAKRSTVSPPPAVSQENTVSAEIPVPMKGS